MRGDADRETETTIINRQNKNRSATTTDRHTLTETNEAIVDSGAMHGLRMVELGPGVFVKSRGV